MTYSVRLVRWFSVWFKAHFSHMFMIFSIYLYMCMFAGGLHTLVPAPQISCVLRDDTYDFRSIVVVTKNWEELHSGLRVGLWGPLPLGERPWSELSSKLC